MPQPHAFTDQPPLNAPVIVPKQAETKPAVSTPPNTSTPLPTVPAPEAPKTEPVSNTASDILKRASTVKTEASPVKETSYREDLEKIQDPAIKAVAEKALKDYEAGYTKKFQELAQKKKEIEESYKWTPQRLAEELKKPEFLTAMQILQQQSAPQDWNGTSEEWSALSESDKRQIQAMRQEQASLQSQLAAMRFKEEDIEIQKQFPHYNPQVVDEAIEGLRKGSITASRADIWKVIEHDNNVERSYQLGIEDGARREREKMNGSSLSAGNPSVTGADEPPDDVKKGGFSSIALWRLARQKNGAKR